jgi:hypothetical protein
MIFIYNSWKISEYRIRKTVFNTNISKQDRILRGIDVKVRSELRKKFDEHNFGGEKTKIYLSEFEAISARVLYTVHQQNYKPRNQRGSSGTHYWIEV